MRSIAGCSVKFKDSHLGQVAYVGRLSQSFILDVGATVSAVAIDRGLLRGVLDSHLGQVAYVGRLSQSFILDLGATVSAGAIDRGLWREVLRSRTTIWQWI